MSLLNYTTTIQVSKTAGEIQALLAKSGASAILTEYNTDGILTGIAFRIKGPHGILSFLLPANIDGIYAVLLKEGKVPVRLRTKEQAARIAWRIIKDWIEAQLSLISARMVSVDQAFLPYIQNPQGITLYQSLKNQNFNGLALPAASTA